MRLISMVLGVIACVAGLAFALGWVGEDADAADAQSASAAGEERLDPRFVASWELVSYVSFRESGEEVDNNYTGRIIYDEYGNMTGVGMPRDLPDRPRNADGSMVRTGFAYYSQTEPHYDEGYVIHHVVASPMMPNWVGSSQVRFFEFDENNEILKLSIREGNSPTGRITGTLTWRRMRWSSDR